MRDTTEVNDSVRVVNKVVENKAPAAICSISEHKQDRTRSGKQVPLDIFTVWLRPKYSVGAHCLDKKNNIHQLQR